ncbi:MAG TPA: protein-L-isoaspartate(D-aspartate) O-methyltransferase, partial [Pseudonocardiaceae bacterium]|nr:protein-L-isoaspartate(D-aspartate) O-methyltransferase [Pseudonocardiaceae bacterium]
MTKSTLSDELGIEPGHRVLEIADGPAEPGPYDRILITEPVTGVRWDWAEQLVPGGQLSVDLAIAGTSGGHVILHRAPDWLTGRLCP